jgi:hypothetical protein
VLRLHITGEKVISTAKAILGESWKYNILVMHPVIFVLDGE